MRTNPLVLIAAMSVIILSLVGVGAITGHISSVNSKTHGTDDAQAVTPGDHPFVSSVVPVQEKPAPARTVVKVAKSCVNCGLIETISSKEKKGDATGIGLVVGAAGGAYTGHEIEKNVNKKLSYQVKVRLDDGTYRVVSLGSKPAFEVGEKVRVVNGTLAHAG
jgi:outer membrane lipoprotein SlyB